MTTMTWVLILLVAVAVGQVAQIVVKLVLFGRIVVLLVRVEQLLTLTEQHGKVSDSRGVRVEEAVKSVKSDTILATNLAANEVKKAVEQVSDKVDRLKP